MSISSDEYCRIFPPSAGEIGFYGNLGTSGSSHDGDDTETFDCGFTNVRRALVDAKTNSATKWGTRTTGGGLSQSVHYICGVNADGSGRADQDGDVNTATLDQAAYDNVKYPLCFVID